MRLRSVSAALATLSLAAAFSVRAQAQDTTDMPEQRYTPPKPQFVMVPIKTFNDAYGLWVGWVDYYTRISMTVLADGTVKFYGPRDVTKVATLRNDRLVLESPSTDLDCGIVDENLACHARFGTWYAELNLTRKQ